MRYNFLLMISLFGFAALSASYKDVYAALQRQEKRLEEMPYEAGSLERYKRNVPVKRSFDKYQPVFPVKEQNPCEEEVLVQKNKRQRQEEYQVQIQEQKQLFLEQVVSVPALPIITILL